MSSSCSWRRGDSDALEGWAVHVPGAGGFRCSGRTSSFCSTSCTSSVTFVTNPVIKSRVKSALALGHFTHVEYLCRVYYFPYLISLVFALWKEVYTLTQQFHQYQQHEQQTPSRLTSLNLGICPLNLVPGLWQAQQCGGVKLVNGIKLLDHGSPTTRQI